MKAFYPHIIHDIIHVYHNIYTCIYTLSSAAPDDDTDDDDAAFDDDGPARRLHSVEITGLPLAPPLPPNVGANAPLTLEGGGDDKADIDLERVNRCEDCKDSVLPVRNVGGELIEVASHPQQLRGGVVGHVAEVHYLFARAARAVVGEGAGTRQHLRRFETV